MRHSHIYGHISGRILPVFRRDEPAAPLGKDRQLDKIDLLLLGLTYIDKSAKLLKSLPHDYWPSPENLETRRLALLRARVLQDIGDKLIAMADEPAGLAAAA